MANELTDDLPTSIDVSGLPGPMVQFIKQLVDSLREEVSSESTASPAKRLLLRGRFAHLNLSLPKEEIDAARREAWSGFPREFPEPGKP